MGVFHIRIILLLFFVFGTAAFGSTYDSIPNAKLLGEMNDFQDIKRSPWIITSYCKKDDCRSIYVKTEHEKKAAEVVALLLYVSDFGTTSWKKSGVVEAFIKSHRERTKCKNDLKCLEKKIRSAYSVKFLETKRDKDGRIDFAPSWEIMD